MTGYICLRRTNYESLSYTLLPLGCGQIMRLLAFEIQFWGKNKIIQRFKHASGRKSGLLVSRVRFQSIIFSVNRLLFHLFPPPPRSLGYSDVDVQRASDHLLKGLSRSHFSSSSPSFSCEPTLTNFTLSAILVLRAMPPANFH